MTVVNYALNIALLALGFGFVIFFHELGHFLAAKWVGIKVEQFAVGFGSAILSWRKGLGFTTGSSGKRYDAMLLEEQSLGRELDPKRIGETEYRLNWIPLGGYVKMLGQDDIRPNSEVSDPRAYNRQSIGARMLVVSAGVIMNIILAAAGFMLLFSLPEGFRAPPALVGGIVPGSPAQNVIHYVNGKPQKASLQAGDRILYYDHKWQHDFTKISLNAALSKEGAQTPIHVRHVDGTEESFFIVPARDDGEGKGFLSLGIEQPRELRGPDVGATGGLQEGWQEMAPKEAGAVLPGEVITAVNGHPVQPDEHYKFVRELQDSNGKAVRLSVKQADGRPKPDQFVQPHFRLPFGKKDLTIAGMAPRAGVGYVDKTSPARGRLLPGDMFVEIRAAGDPTFSPSMDELKKVLNKAGEQNQPVEITVLRGDQPAGPFRIIPSIKVARDQYGLNVGLEVDDKHAIVASVTPGSPAAIANIPRGATLTAINGKPISDWFEVRNELLAAARAAPLKPINISFKTTTGSGAAQLALSEQEVDWLASMRYDAAALALHERIEPRKASNPLQAASWGVTETRDFVLQFYLTLRRMIDGSVSYSNMMGPLGIFSAGTQFAFKGKDWLLWFLSMISANLAVVNFLPIPIVDGGLFTFLILEKIKGRPLSPRTQSIAQVVGLALLLGVFLLVTYQDIRRMSGG